MKIIVGIDAGSGYRSALNLAARLKFSEPEWTLVHSVDTSWLGAGAPGPDGALAPDFLEAGYKAGKTVLERAADDACAHGLRAETMLLAGNVAESLLDYADSANADLVVVQSERKGRLGSLFFGSISRGLAIGAKQSVLISKGDIAPTGRVRAVWATDQSEYADRALEHFLKMRPKGISGIHLVTAQHLYDPDVASDLPVARELLEKSKAKMKADLDMVDGAGFECTGEVVNLAVNEAIQRAMKRADLLVMGAQGHGLMHRMILGSTALHQVVVEPHPVMIVRA